MTVTNRITLSEEYTIDRYAYWKKTAMRYDYHVPSKFLLRLDPVTDELLQVDLIQFIESGRIVWTEYKVFHYSGTMTLVPWLPDHFAAVMFPGQEFAIKPSKQRRSRHNRKIEIGIPDEILAMMGVS